MKGISIILMILTVLSKILGAVRIATLSRLFGTGAEAAAFNLAMSIPVVVFSFIAVGITTGFIPTYKRLEENRGLEVADRFTSNLCNITTVITIVLMVLCQIFAKQLTYVFAFKLNDTARELTTNFLRISLVSLVPISIATVYRGYLNCHGEFIVTALQGFILNVFIILGLYLGKFINVYFLAVGIAVASTVQFLPYIPAVIKKGFKWTKVFDTKEPEIRGMLIMAIPVIIGVSVNQLNVIVDKNLATLIMGERGINVMEYASRLSELVNGIVIISVSTVMYPILSKFAGQKRIGDFKDSIIDTFTSMFILVIPAMVGLIVLAEPIVRFIYEGGNFTREDTLLTAPVLMIYSAGLVAIALRDILFKSYYSLKDTKTPTKNTMFMIAMNIVVSVVSSRFLGLTGLALGTTVAAYFGAILLYFNLKKKIGEFSKVNILMVETFKITIASIVMGGVAYFVNNKFYSSLGANKSMFLAIILAAMVYVVLIFLLRVKEAYNLVNQIKRKFKKR
ncbi:murein biosynthesis integral membrane protein MurJ [Lagierella sp.]|uniref:murein biosynthesis integral membrane protein MurJ n=1 Tax=Lagierella sp. TaxID=2849657 RepID=UPI00262AC213|nr:murein biosynthesis integral membrane protein MurJ [Lagierella sp.]